MLPGTGPPELPPEVVLPELPELLVPELLEVPPPLLPEPLLPEPTFVLSAPHPAAAIAPATTTGIWRVVMAS
jgi:hypothetical protein